MTLLWPRLLGLSCVVQPNTILRAKPADLPVQAPPVLLTARGGRLGEGLPHSA
jgi:hypothetical protein